MNFLLSNAVVLETIWNAIFGGLIAVGMFQWGRRYERKRIFEWLETKQRPPKEPHL